MKPVGFGSFSIFDVKETFNHKTSSELKLFSPDLGITGIKWYVGIKNKDNKDLGICLFRLKDEK